MRLVRSSGFRVFSKIKQLNKLVHHKTRCLDSFEKIKVCIGYELDGQEVSFKSRLLHKVKPIYEEIEGWNQSLNSYNAYEDLPAQVKHFIELIEEHTKTKVSLISNGPNRNDLILR